MTKSSLDSCTAVLTHDEYPMIWLLDLIQRSQLSSTQIYDEVLSYVIDLQRLDYTIYKLEKALPQSSRGYMRGSEDCLLEKLLLSSAIEKSSEGSDPCDLISSASTWNFGYMMLRGDLITS
ncbi:hypothetical protein Tco_0857688 [Tanacetum coccineum]|uniref:Uncharacterized protein n=1 Tax=Tanacetum coccineum TaxID=301880 RepID=A0ABQ5B7T6_9ASTR